ncbi:MAG: ABC transporter substrate-binding protein [Deinococcota bacterium]
MKVRLMTLLLVLAAFGMAQTDVTLTYMTGNRGDDVEIAQQIIQEYMDANPHTIGSEEYNVTVEVIAGPESATDRLGLYLQFFEAQSDEVDIFEIDVIWPGDLAEHLVDLSQFEGVSEAAADFFPAIVENNTVDGALVGMPYFTDAGLLYYREDLLEKYGFDGAPATWSELEDMAATIQEGERSDGNADFWGFVWQGNAYEGLTCDALEWISSFNGGTVISADGVITINNENAVAAVETAAGWVGTISPPGITGFQEEDARNLFQAGNSAFMRNWPYAYSLGQADDSAIQGLIGITTLPSADMEGAAPAATLGGWQVGASAYTEFPQVAADVILHITSYDNQLLNATTNSKLPTRPAVYEDETLLASDVSWFNDLLPVFINAVARPSTISAPQYGETSRLFFTAVHNVLTGEEDAETALSLLELDLEALHGFEIGAP